MLAQVVVDHQHVLALIHEVFAHGAARARAAGNFHQLMAEGFDTTRDELFAYQNDDAGFADFNLVFVIF